LYVGGGWRGGRRESRGARRGKGRRDKGRRDKGRRDKGRRDKGRRGRDIRCGWQTFEYMRVWHCDLDFVVMSRVRLQLFMKEGEGGGGRSWKEDVKERRRRRRRREDPVRSWQTFRS
jgi:hypothetical protein